MAISSTVVPSLHQRRQTLLSRIHQIYETVTEQITVGPASFSFTRIADPNKVLDDVAEEDDRREKVGGHRLPADDLHLPYWAELWDSALGLSQLLFKRAGLGGTGKDSSFNGLSVMDLGCGMGFTGMVAAHLGAKVLFADLEAPALLFAQLNSLAHFGQIRARQLNWRTDLLGERFHLIIGCDILYERVQWESLHQFWQKHLEKKGSLLLAEPGRQTGDLFIPWAKARGWAMEQFEEPVLTRPKPIRIFRLHR